MPREPLVRIVNAVRLIRLLRQYDPQVIRTAYSPQSAITHRIDVRRFAGLKRTALASHRSQIYGVGISFRRLARRPPMPSKAGNRSRSGQTAPRLAASLESATPGAASTWHWPSKARTCSGPYAAASRSTGSTSSPAAGGS